MCLDEQTSAHWMPKYVTQFHYANKVHQKGFYDRCSPVISLIDGFKFPAFSSKKKSLSAILQLDHL